MRGSRHGSVSGRHRTASNSGHNGGQHLQQNDDGWTMVHRRRRGGHGTGAGARAPPPSNIPGLQGAPPPLKDMFVHRVLTGDVGDITNHLKNNYINVVNIERVSHESSAYKSFKVTVSLYDKNKMLRKNIWPNGIRCKVWWHPRNDDVNSNDDDDNGGDDDRGFWTGSLGQPLNANSFVNIDSNINAIDNEDTDRDSQNNVNDVY